MDNGSSLLLVYVDEIQMSGSDKVKIEVIMFKLKNRLHTVGVGNANLICGVQIIRHDDARLFALTQEKYPRSIPKSYSMSDVQRQKTLAEAEGTAKILEEDVPS